MINFKKLEEQGNAYAEEFEEVDAWYYYALHIAPFVLAGLIIYSIFF